MTNQSSNRDQEAFAASSSAQSVELHQTIAELSSLTSQHSELTSRVSALEAQINALSTKIEEVTSSEMQFGDEFINNIVNQVTALVVAQLETTFNAQSAGRRSSSSANTSSKATRRQVLANQSEKCAVAGCDRPVRASGFCGPHYQKYRRNTLPGFVGYDGITTIAGRKFHVGIRYAGNAYSNPVETENGFDVEINGQLVSAPLN